MKITVIGGGNMGGAIAQGAVRATIVAPESVTVADPSPEINQLFGEFNPLINLCSDNSKAIIGSDMIIVAVKPWLIERVMDQISDAVDRERQMVVSIAAGVTFDDLRGYLNCDQKGEVALYRVMPNTAISLGESTTFICNHNSSAEQDAMIISLFDALGKTFVIEQSQMTAMTALASCGIAYIFKYIDASIKGGVEMGVDEQVAREVVLQTVGGALKILNTDKNSPQAEIDRVTTPGGITLKGLEEMERCGFSDAVIKGLLASK